MIFTLYRADEYSDDEIIDFITGKEDIQVITMPKTRVKRSFCRRIHKAGKQVYTHVIDDLNSLYRYRNKGVDGAYTNIISAASYETIR